jgi:DNA polymerase III subunit gamma/tau
MLGSVDRSHVLHMIRALTEGDGAAVVNQVNALRLQGVSAAATLEDMAMLLQRMAVMQMVPSMAQDGDDPDTQGLADLAKPCPPKKPNCSTACACTGAPSWAWPRTNTRR